MRDHKTMMNLIIDVAKQDKRIRAVALNGSRVDPCAKKDRFQDYDITYYVDDFNAFPKDTKWIDVFGKRIAMQTRDDQLFIPDDTNDPNWYIYLMLFEDGTRIDLSIVGIDRMEADAYHGDGFFRLLLDKDSRLKNVPPIHDHAFHVKKPDESLYDAAVTECLWLIPSVGKGIERQEYPYAMEMLKLVRDTLRAMCNWAIGIEYDFKINVGMFSKRFKTLLKKEWHEAYLKTYPLATRESVYQAINVLLFTFKEVATYVASELNYTYDDKTHENVSNYIQTLEKQGYYSKA